MKSTTANQDLLTPLIDAVVACVLERLQPYLGAMNTRPRLLTVQQAAAYLGRTPEAIYGMRKRGTIPVVQTDGRVFFDIQDLDRWIEQNKT
jgi:excisionase family DNA binding protein